MHNKAMLKTFEAFIAITMILLFLVIVLANVSVKAPQQLDIMDALVKDDGFRACIASDSITCAENVAKGFVPRNYEFLIVSSASSDATSPSLPARKNVISESAFFSGNQTKYNPRIVRIYYWKK